MNDGSTHCCIAPRSRNSSPVLVLKYFDAGICWRVMVGSLMVGEIFVGPGEVFRESPRSIKQQHHDNDSESLTASNPPYERD
jgi:hypothetical protein